MGERDYRNETTTFHVDVEGQANPNFSHRNDWERYCTFCKAKAVPSREPEVAE